jgi:purine-nucleoside phosphorylase
MVSSFATFSAEAQKTPPEIALVLGSGLGAFVHQLQVVSGVAFADVPGLAGPTVAGHAGRVLLGSLAGRRLLVFEGRLHYYESHSWARVAGPVRLARSLGARLLLVTNAAGGIRADLTPGSLLALRDHINWTCPYYWRQSGPGGIGPPRPSPYSPRLLHLLRSAAKALDLPLPQGVYAALTGPSYETPAEIRALGVLGADAVGMSTAHEIETGHELGMECAGLSCITNRAAGLAVGPIHHGEVLTTAQAQSGRLAELLERFIKTLP